MKRLFLFTAAFPYDSSETFLEDEIPYLASAFDIVTIVPLYGDKLTRSVPDNCVVLPPVESKGYRRYLSLLIPNKATGLFVVDFIKKKVFLSLKRIKTWLIAFRQTCNLLRAPAILDIFSTISQEDVCYFYWGKGSVVLSALFKKRAVFVSRFHGEWDLWEESSGNYAPLRNRIADCLDIAAFISEKGKEYFCKKYTVKRAEVFPLGSFDNGISERSTDNIIRIVSCSSVYPLKRVLLIFDALFASDREIEWTHIGGGVQLDELKDRVKNFKRSGFKVNLVGNVAHDEVINYYRSHSVDLFINLSTNEGVPVSIMEAISFNIPVIATNVGATSEIVGEETGMLIDANPSIDVINNAINEVIDKGDSIQPKIFWQGHYDASKNYTYFAESIVRLL